MSEAAVQEPEVVEGDVVTEKQELAPAKPGALPAPATRRGITESQWRMLFNLYPGALPESALMVWDYCKTRGLDPMKKPCHIVPISVKNARTGNYEWRDVVMPGIYEYRITAHRTGLYNGHSEPEFGEDVKFAGVTAPAWCAMTALRFNPKTGKEMSFPVKVYFREVVATKRDGNANERWCRAPIQMLTKCAEAAALREAFPEEFGGEPTEEERAGDEPKVTVEPPPADPVRRSEKSDTSSPAPEQAQSSPAPCGDASASAPVPSTPPAAAETKPVTSSPAAAPASTGPGQITKNVRISEQLYIGKSKISDKPYYEVKGEEMVNGRARAGHTWVTQDEQLAKMSASCEGTESLFTITWHLGHLSGAQTTAKPVRILTAIAGA